MSDLVSDLQSINEEKLNSEPYTCELIAKTAADEITRLREDLASAKRAAAAYEAWKFPEDIQALTVENERLLEENARLREQNTELVLRGYALLSLLAPETTCGELQQARDAMRAVRAAIREGRNDA